MNDILKRIHGVADVYQGRHLVYTSGDHGDGYVNYRPLGQEQNRLLLREACVLILQRAIEHAKLDTAKPITVIGPQTLGAIMAEQLFYASSNELPLCLNTRIFAKAEDGKGFVWASSPQNVVNKDAQIVWVDDLLNAGSTFTQTQELVKACGARVRVIGVIGDRSGLSAADLGVDHIEALERFTLNRYKAEECPLCFDHVPILRKPGHGHEFEKQRPDYAGGYIDA